MIYLLLISILSLQTVLLEKSYSSFDPPPRSEVLPTIRRSLMRSLPTELQTEPVSEYLSEESLRGLENILENRYLRSALEVQTEIIFVQSKFFN